MNQVLYASLSRAMVIHITLSRDPAQKAAKARRQLTKTEWITGPGERVICPCGVPRPAIRPGLETDPRPPAMTSAFVPRVATAFAETAKSGLCGLICGSMPRRVPPHSLPATNEQRDRNSVVF